MASAHRSLDVGGWHRPIRSATHVIDINPYDTRLTSTAFDADRKERYSNETWLRIDICEHVPWPFPDGYFDFAVCSHVLEDIRDPIWVVSELSRVARQGYIECPSSEWELLGWVTLAEYMSSSAGCVGALHHRWFVEFVDGGSIVFRMKPYDLARENRYVPVTKFHAVQYDKQATGIFWKTAVSAREEIFDIRKWIDERLPQARELVKFDPVGRIRSKLQRTLGGQSPPEHSDIGDVKFPYL